jgi:hypothetical protein
LSSCSLGAEIGHPDIATVLWQSATPEPCDQYA